MGRIAFKSARPKAAFIRRGCLFLTQQLNEIFSQQASEWLVLLVHPLEREQLQLDQFNILTLSPWPEMRLNGEQIEMSKRLKK